MIRGLRSNTAENLLLGAGAFYKNFVHGTDTPTNTTGKAKLIGATDGGGTFAATMSVRQVSVDGNPTNVKGFEVNDGWTVTLTANVKEATADTLQLALGSCTVDSTTKSGETSIVGNGEIADSDYVDNITWCGSLSDGRFVEIELFNALSINGLNLTVADKNEATIPVTLTGHYTTDDLETPPFKIYIVG